VDIVNPEKILWNDICVEDRMKRRWLGMLILLVIAMLLLSACAKAEINDESGEAAKPSIGGGPGEAVNLTGDPTKGAEIFTQYCVACHGDQGKGGVANLGSLDKEVPPLNPIDPSMVSSDTKTFATNIDLFIEHGSVPEPEKEGATPEKSMLAFGDQKTLDPQQIADVIAYVISLNK
jgi:mono/diheme cytochrome c family protein